ncbi:hypothetical protein TNCV_1592731 [Trichonephila clavipes]|nr:hypothetical protein TNCV_1592731 [Trichonephila clavipes]
MCIEPGDYTVQAIECLDKQRLLRAKYSSLQKTKENCSFYTHPLPFEPEGPIQQMTASSPDILINHQSGSTASFNESGVTSTRYYPNHEDCRSRRLSHPLPCSPPPS